MWLIKEIRTEIGKSYEDIIKICQDDNVRIFIATSTDGKIYEKAISDDDCKRIFGLE